MAKQAGSIQADSTQAGSIDFSTRDEKQTFWHSSAHLLAHAVLDLWPDVRIAIGPAIEHGFYYDFDRKEPFTPEDLKRIEKRMHEIAKKDYPIKRKELTKKEALKLFGKNPYKAELIEEFAKEEKLSAYRQGDFIDLCKGPHVKSTGLIKAMKLTKVAGAYWRGDAKNRQLQRIYGISFPKQEMLKEHLKMLEEAEKRDHRRIGILLDLFSFHDEAKGAVFWHPKGMVIFNGLVDYLREELLRIGYQEIKTPAMLNKHVWQQSGHWDHYKDSMYFTKVDNEDYAVKPMNCPGSTIVYRAKYRSYKELPLKLAEFGMNHRHELSGVLSGLTRVRAFTMDDAHIFCTKEQLQGQIKEMIELATGFYKLFGFKYHIELSTRPEKAMGSQKLWDEAESALQKALESEKIHYQLNPGEGAFYGPKIDFHIKDALQRSWQLCTIQVDFQMPEKFDLRYMGEDGTNNHRPVMIHRAILGSLERFVALLLEHFAGHLPLWISPVQAKVITISEKNSAYARDVVTQLKDAGIRTELDARTESVGYKVREAQLQKANYILVVGDKEQEGKTVNVRTRKEEVLGPKPLQKVISQLKDEIGKKEVK